MEPGNVFTAHHFLRTICIGSDKLECYPTLGWKYSPLTNIAPYFAYSKIIKNIKCCEYSL